MKTFDKITFSISYIALTCVSHCKNGAAHIKSFSGGSRVPSVPRLHDRRRACRGISSFRLCDRETAQPTSVRQTMVYGWYMDGTFKVRILQVAILSRQAYDTKTLHMYNIPEHVKATIV